MADKKLGEAKYIRLYQVQLDKIENYRAKKRPIPDISETVRELIDKALETQKED